MKRVFSLAAEAKADLLDALASYDKADGAVATRFAAAVAAGLVELERRPDAYPVTYGRLRRLPVEGFPYGIFYRVTSTRVHVAGILHGRRDLSVLRRRK